MAAPERVVALLRSVNVGGHNKLPMADLRKALGAAGCTDVQTYIQSGNILYRPPAGADPRALLAQVLADGFGLDVPIVLRSGAALRAVRDGNPFLDQADDIKQLHVGFMDGTPNPDAIAGLDPGRSPPDRFQVVDREIFLLLPNGMARSKLTNAWFDRQLGVTSTFRNWRTVGKLVEMVGG